MKLLSATLVVVGALAFAPPSAWGLLGDRYGAAPINDHPSAIQAVRAIPANDAFWAGACDRSVAHAFGSDFSLQGGFGSRRDFVLAGTDAAVVPRLEPPITIQTKVPAPESPDHCLDPGAQTSYQLRDLQQGKIWQTFPYDTGRPYPSGPLGATVGQALAPDCMTPADALSVACDFAPSWRLPALTNAGGHPDGSSLFAWNRSQDGAGAAVGSVDGSVDNIYVDLPPGFVGNPQAVPQCTNEEFRGRPLLCPPETQVGVLRLNLEGVCVGTPCNLPSSYDATYPVYNLEPRRGKVAELGFAYAGGAAAIRIVGIARTNGDFGVSGFVGQIPAALVPIAQEITLWGVPWATENDIWRPKFGHAEAPTIPCRTEGFLSVEEYIPPGGLPGEECQTRYDSSWGEIKPFLANETDCGMAPTVRLATDAFQNPGGFTEEGDPDLPPAPQLLSGAAADASGWKTYQSVSPATTGCADLDFEPDLDLEPTSSSADGASGLHARLEVPQNNQPRDVGGDVLDPDTPDYLADASDYWNSEEGRATAHLKDSVVTLPPGMSVNPSSANGLEGCSDAEIGMRPGSDAYSGRHLFNNGDPFDKDGGEDGAECPDASKIGTARVNTPLLAEELTGEVVLGQPLSTDPMSGRMIRMFIVVRQLQRGLVAKIYGSATLAPSTGQITATFENNPEVPFDDLSLDFKGGARGMLALPGRCGSPEWDATFTPWSAANGGGGAPKESSDAFEIDGNCRAGFAPTLEAGMSTRKARSHGAFSFRFARAEGQQSLRGLTAHLPQGLLASVKDLPLCRDAQAAAGACPVASKIGIVDAKAGSGNPFVLEEKGDVFLTEGYKGGPYGLMVKVRPVAGPFRGAMELSPIIVRQAIHVDRSSAQVTAVSDPFPLIHHGVPLRVREVTVLVDRDRFMLNPSDCKSGQVGAEFASDEGSEASPADSFQVSGCASLPFKPTLALRLSGRKQVTTGKHPGIRAQVTQQGVPEAGIEKAVVRLPKSLALDVNNAQALCEFADGTKPDLENHCPKGSIVGRARAVSPLLNDPLVGNVYFVKNVRTDPRTGNQIRTLPMIVVALRGEIAVNLKGESDTTRAGKLVNTFSGVPDAPVSQFNLNISGGKNGVVAVTRTRRALINLCNSGRQMAEVDMDGQNGKRHDFDVSMTKPCERRARAVCRTRKQMASRVCKAKAKRLSARRM